MLKLNTYSILGTDDLVSALDAVSGGRLFQMHAFAPSARRDL